MRERGRLSVGGADAVGASAAECALAVRCTRRQSSEDMFRREADPGVYHGPTPRYPQYAQYYHPCPSTDPDARPHGALRRGCLGPSFVSTSASFDNEFPPISAAAPARLFTAKTISSGPGSRCRSMPPMPPEPNNWMMELQWELVEVTASAFTTDPEAALRTVAAKFATAWLAGGFEGGVFYASIPLSSRAPPCPIARSQFWWQEPYHTPSPDTSLGLEDAVVREMLLRMNAAYAA